MLAVLRMKLVFLVAWLGTLGVLTACQAQEQPIEPHKPILPVDRVEPERVHFRSLTLANPNYFGNLKGSLLKPVKPMIGNVTYEELPCVGFNPDFDRLEAVVLVKQPVGYSGSICSNGSQEYVRFYLSFDNGATWIDQGITSFTAYDIADSPGKKKPIEYAVTLPIAPKKKFCPAENLPKVRAILSWNSPPPPNTPDFPPPWGNVKEAHIQIGGRPSVTIIDWLDEVKLKLPKDVTPLVNLNELLSVPEPAALSTAELHDQYKDSKVEKKRYLFPEVHQKALSKGLVMTAADQMILPQLSSIDWPVIIGEILQTDGDTSYEELKCVGLNPVMDHLIGVLTVKLPGGYSGLLCSSGSREYVAFWVDWGGGVWEYVGTSSVRVHDIATIPADDLQYAVFLPIDTSAHRQRCEKGPVTAKVRAILSWETPPPPNNPDYKPHWGNREETLVHIYPGNPSGGAPSPFMDVVGGMFVDDIASGTGLAIAGKTSPTAGFSANDNPFGGVVVVAGHIGSAPNISEGATKILYRVSVSGDGGLSWSPLNNPITVNRTQLLDGLWSILPTLSNQVPTADGWYTYQEDLTTGSGDEQILVAGNQLGRWNTGSLSGIWKIKLEAKDSGGTIFLDPQVVTVLLDNVAPDALITITSGGGGCADFLEGTTVEGTYSITDDHFGSMSLAVLPALGGSFTQPNPFPSYPTTSATVVSGTWKFNTIGLPKCGYVVRLIGSDRTIVNSGSVGQSDDAYQGLCLRPK